MSYAGLAALVADDPMTSDYGPWVRMGDVIAGMRAAGVSEDEIGSFMELTGSPDSLISYKFTGTASYAYRTPTGSGTSSVGGMTIGGGVTLKGGKIVTDLRNAYSGAPVQTPPGTALPPARPWTLMDSVIGLAKNKLIWAGAGVVVLLGAVVAMRSSKSGKTTSNRRRHK